MVNSGFHNKFRLLPQIQTQFRFLRQLHTARGTTRQLYSQLNALFRFSSQLHTRIELISLFEHHSQIIKSCLVMIIGHSNCEKGYKGYNISDNDHNQWRTSLKVDSNMTRGNKYNLNLLITIWRAKRARKFFWILTSQTSQ